MEAQKILHADLYVTSRGDYGYGVFLIDTSGWLPSDFEALDASSNERRLMTALELQTAARIRNVISGLDDKPSPLHQPKGVSDVEATTPPQGYSNIKGAKW